MNEQNKTESGSEIELMSGNISKLATALAVAQGQMTGAMKDGNNPHFGKTYATLNSVVEAIRKPFSDNGLSYVQLPYNSPNRIGVKTILLHNSGEWISSTMEMPILKVDPQGFGSALTYCRRYTLMAISGIAPDDDDGNEASDMNRAPKKVQQAQDVRPRDDKAAEQAAWEAAKGIAQKSAEPEKEPQPTADDLAQKAIAAQRKKKFDSLPDDIKAYFRALKLSYGKIFEILDANQNDPVAVRAYIAENPIQPQGETLAEKLSGEGMAAAG